MADMPVLSVAAGRGDLIVQCAETDAQDEQDAEIVQALIKVGADVKATNEAGYTALHGAAYGGHSAVGRVLLEAGASVDAKTKDGVSPLHSAAIGCRTEMVRLLLSAGAGVDSRDGRNSTPLHWAVPKGHCVQVVEALIQAGADVNAVEDAFGDSPLMSATQFCSSGTEQIVADLLDAGANPLIANRRRENAVSRASSAHCGNAQVYRMIAERARLFLGSSGQNF